MLADHIINGIFLFGLMTGLLTISYLTGIEEIEETEWEGPKKWVPAPEEDALDKSSSTF